MATTKASMREQSSVSVREETRLRRVAEGLLAGGQAPPTRGWEVGADALALLYRLANDMDRSGDALAVLHELQVHQVELDLQLEQLESNEEQLTEELQRYRDLYEQAPVGYLRICPDGRILEANETASRIIDAVDGEREGVHVHDLIDPEDRASLATMLERLGAHPEIASCDARAVDAAADAPALRLTARREPDSDVLWLIVS